MVREPHAAAPDDLAHLEQTLGHQAVIQLMADLRQLHNGAEPLSPGAAAQMLLQSTRARQDQRFDRILAEFKVEHGGNPHDGVVQRQLTDEQKHRFDTLVAAEQAQTDDLKATKLVPDEGTGDYVLNSRGARRAFARQRLENAIPLLGSTGFRVGRTQLQVQNERGHFIVSGGGNQGANLEHSYGDTIGRIRGMGADAAAPGLLRSAGADQDVANGQFTDEQISRLLLQHLNHPNIDALEHQVVGDEADITPLLRQLAYFTGITDVAEVSRSMSAGKKNETDDGVEAIPYDAGTIVRAGLGQVMSGATLSDLYTAGTRGHQAQFLGAPTANSDGGSNITDKGGAAILEDPLGIGESYLSRSLDLLQRPERRSEAEWDSTLHGGGDLAAMGKMTPEEVAEQRRRSEAGTYDRARDLVNRKLDDLGNAVDGYRDPLTKIEQIDKLKPYFTKLRSIVGGERTRAGGLVQSAIAHLMAWAEHIRQGVFVHSGTSEAESSTRQTRQSIKKIKASQTNEQKRAEVARKRAHDDKLAELRGIRF